MKKKHTQKRLIVFTAVSIAVSTTLLCLTIWVYIVKGEKVPLSPIAFVLYALLLVRIVLDYFHDRIQNKKSRLYLQSVIDTQQEEIESMYFQITNMESKLELAYAEKPKDLFFDAVADYNNAEFE